MKKIITLLFSVAAMSVMMSCNDDKKDKDPEPQADKGITYKGTLSVGEEEDNKFVMENVAVTLTYGDRSAAIEMKEVTFSAQMPVKLTMTIPGITVQEADGKTSLSGDKLIPTAMGGEFPQYTITGFTGEATPETLSFEMTCATFPTKFTGTKQQ